MPEYRILRPVARPQVSEAARHDLRRRDREPASSRSSTGCRDEAHYSRPPQDEKPAILYVSHHSADAELRDEPLVAELLKAEPKAAFYACDVRGIGESRPDTCGGSNQFLTPYGSDYFYAIHAIMLDRPYVGQKTFDVLRVLDWLADIGHKEVHLVGEGLGRDPGDVRRRAVGRASRR